jgi:putative transposase
MGRQTRTFEADGIYHVMSRGSNRETVFRFDGDRIAFLDRMAAVADRYSIRWISYCLMGNHYHAIAQTPDASLSHAMRDLHGGYSRLQARVHGRDAHLFKNRFIAEHVDTPAYFATVMRYIHLNPVRAGLCGHPAGWAWSSYRATIGLDTGPRFLRPDVFLRIDGTNLRAAQADYASFVEAGIANALRSSTPREAGALITPRPDRVESAA